MHHGSASLQRPPRIPTQQMLSITHWMSGERARGIEPERAIGGERERGRRREREKERKKELE